MNMLILYTYRFNKAKGYKDILLISLKNDRKKITFISLIFADQIKIIGLWKHNFLAKDSFKSM